jgi:hypothetical protein
VGAAAGASNLGGLVRQVVAAPDGELGLYAVAGAVLQEVRDREQQRQAEELRDARERRASKRLAADRWIAIAALAALVTVVVPTAVGRWIGRDSTLFPPGFEAPGSVRNALRDSLTPGGLWPVGQADQVFDWVDYFAGALLLAALAAAAVSAIPPWRGRWRHLAAAGAALIGCVAAYPAVLGLWEEREAAAESIGVAPYQAKSHQSKVVEAYGNVPARCGLAVATVDAAGGRGESDLIELDGHRYYVRAVYHDPDTDYYYADAAACNRVVVYRDWTEIARFELVDGVARKGWLCDTDGTPEGLVWWSLARMKIGGGWDQVVIHFRFADLAWRDGPAIATLAGFVDQHRMCL